MAMPLIRPVKFNQSLPIYKINWKGDNSMGPNTSCISLTLNVFSSGEHASWGLSLSSV